MPAIVLAGVSLTFAARAQVHTTSDGSDGTLNPTADTIIDMSSHSDGVFQYTSVNIPQNVTVTFTPNANNSPVTWLVQGTVVISGRVDISGHAVGGFAPGPGGPGGGAGGWGGPGPRTGQGLGGGDPAPASNLWPPGSGSYATTGLGGSLTAKAGLTYGNQYLLPLQGGSGSGGFGYVDVSGVSAGVSGVGGGGAILIASDVSITINGYVIANGAHGDGVVGAAEGSGGGIRLLAPQLLGQGVLSAVVGAHSQLDHIGDGYIRLDADDDQFRGYLLGSWSRGFNAILALPSNANVRLAIQSIAANGVPLNPTGALATPDVIIPAQQANLVPVVVTYANIPLNTTITVVANPANAPAVVATAMTDASGTATLTLALPRGGGTIYARAVVPVASGLASLKGTKQKAPYYAATGLTAEGEGFGKMEITAGPGGRQVTTYITDSGKRFTVAGK